MRHERSYLIFLILLLVSVQSFAQKIYADYSSLPLRKPTGEPMATLVNINNISMWVQADGRLVPKPYPRIYNPTNWSVWGVFYPRGTAGVVYQDGIIWGGLIYDGLDSLIRYGGSDYSSGLQPGRIITKGVAEDPDALDVRIWRIRRDWQIADLTRDASDFFTTSVDSLTEEQIAAVRAQYEKDWYEWPWQKGAPFYDMNDNGIMDIGEEPGLAYADQVIWYVANDLNTDVTKKFWSATPIGIEMQVTLWAYNRSNYHSDKVLSNVNKALQNVIFRRVRLIYKGRSDTPTTARIDSMYIGQWSDPDIGALSYDLVGCDTTLNMGFAYNDRTDDPDYEKFDLPPPSVGYTILYGPVVPSREDQALFNLKVINDYTNLPMTSFAWQTGPFDDDPCGPTGDHSYSKGKLWYQVLRGYFPISSYHNMYYPHPPGVKEGPFPLAGDPVTRTGHIDGIGVDYSMHPGERRIICGSGPFTMALGDKQEVIVAIVGGLGPDRLASISVMKYFAIWARSHIPYIFEMGFQEEEEPQPEKMPLPQYFRLYQNYPNPFNTSTEIRYDLPVKKNVKLTIYNLLGQVVKVLVNETQDASAYAYKWDGTDVRGEKVPTGIYLYRIEAGYWVLTRKMILLE